MRRDPLRDQIDREVLNLLAGKDHFDPNQPRDPHTGEWIEYSVGDVFQHPSGGSGAEIIAMDERTITYRKLSHGKPQRTTYRVAHHIFRRRQEGLWPERVPT